MFESMVHRISAQKKVDETIVRICGIKPKEPRAAKPEVIITEPRTKKAVSTYLSKEEKRDRLKQKLQEEKKSRIFFKAEIEKKAKEPKPRLDYKSAVRHKLGKRTRAGLKYKFKTEEERVRLRYQLLGEIMETASRRIVDGKVIKDYARRQKIADLNEQIKIIDLIDDKPLNKD